MKLSILLPFKNASQWIEETIKSIVEQAFSDWELICVNDHSTDNSASIVEQFTDSRIELLQNEGKGIIPALQTAFASAQGEFITRMDADDIMPTGRLQLMVEMLNRSPKKTVVTGKVEYFSSKQVSEGYRNYEQWLNERIEKNDHFAHIYRECVVASPNWMVRKDEMYDIMNNLQYPEDYDMVFRWKENDFNIQGIDEVTLHWREHPQRTSRNSDVYDQASFFQLKLNWFLQLERVTNKTLAIFGAGQKGKITANFLIDHGIKFNWYDVNFGRYSSPLLDKQIRDPEDANEELALFCVYPNPIDQLDEFLNKKGFDVGQNCWLL